MPHEDGQRLADLWEQAEQQLRSHVIQCLDGRNAFDHSFYIARDLAVRGYEISPLSSVFSHNHEEILNLREEPVKFVNDYLKPTLEAMDLIFNWDKSIKAPEGANNELRCAHKAGHRDNALQFCGDSQAAFHDCASSVCRCCKCNHVNFTGCPVALSRGFTWLA